VLQTGTRLNGRYEIEQLIAAGPVESTWLARPVQSPDRAVEIRAMRVAAVSAEGRQAARRRAERLRALPPNPWVSRVVDAFEEAPTFYLVSESVGGEFLDRVIRQGVDLPLEQRVAWIRTLCAAVAALQAHDPSLIFHVLRPGGVVIAQGMPYLSVFGAAHLFDAHARVASVLQSSEAAGFAAPEEYDAKRPVDGRADVYSLGALLYFVSTRRVPPPAYLRGTARGRLRLPSHIHRQFPPPLEGVITRAISLDPEERWASVGALEQALDGLAARRREQASPGPTALVASVLVVDLERIEELGAREQAAVGGLLGQAVRATAEELSEHHGEIYTDVRGGCGVMVFYNHLAGPLEAATLLWTRIQQGFRGGAPLRVRIGVDIGRLAVNPDGAPSGDALDGARDIARGLEGDSLACSDTYATLLASRTDRYRSWMGLPRALPGPSGIAIVPLEGWRGTAVSPPRPPPALFGPAPGFQKAVSLPHFQTPQAAVEAVKQRKPRPPRKTARFTVTRGADEGRVLALPERDVLIGRGEPGDGSADRLDFDDTTISRIQALIKYDPERAQYAILHEPKATNPTYLNNRALRQRHVLRHGDVVKMGRLVLTFEQER
jgi:hypothetical protein